MSNHNSPLNAHLDVIKRLADEGRTNSYIVAHLRTEHGVATSETAVRRAKKRAGVVSASSSGHGSRKVPSVKVSGDTAEINSPLSSAPVTPDDLMLSQGFDPADWELSGEPQLSWWGNPENPSYQMKIKIRRKSLNEFIVPARAPDYVVPRHKKRSKENRPQLWVLPGDQHAPMHSKDMHAAFVSMLHDVKPDRGLLMGDGLDFANVSRHKDNPEWSNTAQECLDGYHRIVCDYVSSSVETEWQQLWGNHCLRLRGDLLARAERLYGIKPANSPEAKDFLDLGNLLHFKDLGIQSVDPVGEYTHAQVQIAPDLIARHGWTTGPNAMSSALKGLTCSVIFGHVHSAASRAGTRWTPEGNPHHVWAFENGTMSEIKGGHGYAVDVNWTPALSTVEVWPDGRWHHDFARFVDGKLYWRNKRYS